MNRRILHNCVLVACLLLIQQSTVWLVASRPFHQQQPLLVWSPLPSSTVTYSSSSSSSSSAASFSDAHNSVDSRHTVNDRYSRFTQILILRGGSDDEDEETEDDSEVDDEEEDDESVELASREASVVDDLLVMSQKVVKMTGTVLMKTAKTTAEAVSRAIRAAMEGGKSEEDEDAGDQQDETVVTKVVNVLKRMWYAILNPDTDASEVGQTYEGVKPSKKEKKQKQSKTDPASEPVTIEGASSTISESDSVTPTTKPSSDFGNFLASSYGVTATRKKSGSKKATPVLGGSLDEALQYARSTARLVFVYIPVERPPNKNKLNHKTKKPSPDQKAIDGFLSLEVAKVAEKKPRKKGQTKGSFVLWSARAGSPEAVAAIKRIKAEQTDSKGKRRPILLVVYPAQRPGRANIAPKLLAQHHCTPPPPATQMAAWLDDLRKRHAKQYATMQVGVRETELLQERKARYKGSIQSDVTRREEERKEKEARVAREREEAERIKALEQRREELRESLPSEPNSDAADVRTISLRLADGRKAQRRFTPSTEISTLFDWVDVTFEIERELVTLTSMNGKISFSWDDDSSNQTLEEAGLAKMTALRVIDTQTDAESTEEEI